MLIVESEYLIALDIQRILESQSAARSAIFSFADDALVGLDDGPVADLAIVSAGFDKQSPNLLAAELVRRGVAVVVITGDIGLFDGHPALPGTPVVQKPFSEANLLSACRIALSSIGRPSAF